MGAGRGLGVMTELFESQGFRVTAVSRVVDAVGELDRATGDVVISDLELPDGSGLSVLRAARTGDPARVVILLGEDGATSTILEAMRQGAWDYLVRPVDLGELGQVVDRGITARGLSRENRRLVSDLTRANAALRRHEEKLEREVREATERLRRLHGVGREITSSLDLDATFELIVGGASRLTRARASLVFSLDDTTGVLRCEATHGLSGVRANRRAIMGGLLYGVLARHRPLRLGPETMGSCLGDPIVRLTAARRLLVVPLELKGSVLGLLVVADRRVQSFTADDEELLTLFAMQAANAIGNARVHQKLKEVERLKSDFVAMVSHELRTPLTAMKGSLDVLHEEGGSCLDPDRLELLTICRSNTKRLLSIVDDILDFNRLEASRLRMSFESLDPVQTVQASVISLDHLAREAGIRVEVKSPDEPIRIVADEGRLHQVIVNLLSNAFKFSPRGGRVRVSTRAEKQGVRVVVRDEGCGIAASDQPRLFTKFTQLDAGTTRRASGAGLGLVISKAIVEAHGGRIWATSRLGEGSAFSFWLPADPRPRRESTSDAGKVENKKVLPGAQP